MVQTRWCVECGGSGTLVFAEFGPSGPCRVEACLDCKGTGNVQAIPTVHCVCKAPGAVPSKGAGNLCDACDLDLPRVAVPAVERQAERACLYGSAS